MPLFKCAKCHAIENTALSNHAVDWCEGRDPICSECETGRWHGRFPKRHAVGMNLASDGFLYSDEAVADCAERFVRQKIRVLGKVQADGSVT
jgi:hypothetical protein